MIDCFTYEDAHLFGDALASQFRLRHKVFIERQGWGVPNWRGMEYDQYDTPAAVYCVWRDEESHVRGVARLAPTTVPYMIRDLWPDLVTEEPLPCAPHIWESTRLGIDHDLPKETRRRVLSELVLAYLEASLRYGVEGLIGIGYAWCWEHSFSRQGWPVRRMGPDAAIDGEASYVGLLPVSAEILAAVRKSTGIHHPVLRTADDLRRAATSMVAAE
ncbi:MAG: hypothetical protein NVV74_11625 [Magnetospirillum sp.]|nr:hypothetical protein [Magnetospirillum sp.]